MKPFLKWPGGKYRLVETISAHLDVQANRLIEPFAGSAAVFLNTFYSSNVIADTNQDLITLFSYLKKDKKDFICYVESFFAKENNTQSAYLALRKQFNTTNDPREKSALFIFLNRHGYNGLCRYNKKGEFNVPFGRHQKPYFPEKELFFFCEKSQKADFICADFRKTLGKAKKGDVVYCDPPYVPLSDTSKFTTYDGNGFTYQDQQDLADIARDLSKKGITVVISNHNTPELVQTYAGATFTKFNVRRFISCNGESRGYAPELIATFA